MSGQTENKGVNMDKSKLNATFDELDGTKGKEEVEKPIKLQSVVKMPDEIIWDTDVKNKFILTSVLNDDLSLTVTIDGKTFNLRSPDYRLVDDIETLKKKEEKEGLLKAELAKASELQLEMIEDMIIGLDLSDRSIRIETADIALLVFLCWRYHTFLMQKSVAIESQSISGSRD